MASDLQVCSNALLLLSDIPLENFDDTDLGKTCKGIFPLVKKIVLSSGPWRFNKKKSELLNRTVQAPPTQYKYIYAFPPDMLTGLPRTVWNSPFNQGRSTQFRDFDIFDEGLFTSAEKILIDYSINKDTSTFPPHVEQLYVYAMAAAIALTVTGIQATVDSAEVKAWGLPSEKGKGGFFRAAQRIDSQGHPSQSIKAFPLTAVRHGSL